MLRRLSATVALLLTVPLHAAPDAAKGKSLFASRCSSCHAVGPAAHSSFGPQLNALGGRRAGSASDFAYSPAMKQSGLVWSQATLTRFLQDPGEVVPGTKMRFWGLSQGQAQDVAAYLTSAAPAR
ncbi:MAG: c-type cytochrome [Gammaproteobacteria bacterium]